MNILRESNSVLRDEKTRALDEKENANKTIKDLQLEIEPLRRKENEFSEELKKKDAEKKAIEDTITKLKASHEEQIKKISSSRVAADQVKKIVASRDDFKKKFDEKAAEARAKENELNDLRQKENKAQQQVQSLSTELANLVKNKAENQEKQDETQKQLAELKQKITEEKSKSDCIRNIAKKYKTQDAEKATKIAELESKGGVAKKETSHIEIQTDSTENVASEKQEVEMMKKMLQNQISKLKDDFSKKDAALKTIQTALEDEKKKKEKILVNAKRKIQKLNSDL